MQTADATIFLGFAGAMVLAVMIGVVKNYEKAI